MSTDEDKLRLYIAQGETCYRKGDYKRAVNAYTEALQIKLDDRNLLLARSQCYVALGQAKEAIEDANECIKSDETFYKGLYQKAEALYAAGEFEFALVYYYRAHRLRTDILEYRLGIQKAEQAILRAISQDSAPPMMSGNRTECGLGAPYGGTFSSGSVSSGKKLKTMQSGQAHPSSATPSGMSNASSGSRGNRDKSTRAKGGRSEEVVEIPEIAAPQTVYGQVFSSKGYNNAPGRSGSNGGGNTNSGSTALHTMGNQNRDNQQHNSHFDGSGSGKVIVTSTSPSPSSTGRNKKAPELSGKAQPSQRLLGELYDDRKFLEDLKRDEAITRSKDGGIGKIVDAGIEYIDARTEFWRQQKPPSLEGSSATSGLCSLEGVNNNNNNNNNNTGTGTTSGGEVANNTQGGNAQAAGGGGYVPLTQPVYGRRAGTSSQPTLGKVETSMSRQVSRSLTYIQQSLSNILSALAKGTPALALQISQALVRRVEEATNTPTGALKEHPDRQKIRCDAFTALGWSYFESGDYGKSFMAYERALDEVVLKDNGGDGEAEDEEDEDDDEVINSIKAHGDLHRVLRSVRNLARSSQRTPDIERTKSFYLKILKIGERQREIDDVCVVPRVYIMDSFIQLARLLFDGKDFNNALMYTNEVLNLVYPDIVKELSPTNSRSEMDNDYNRSIDLLDQDLLTEIAAEQSGFEQTVPTYPLDPTPQELLLDTLCLIGRIWYMQKDYQTAYRALRICQVLSKVFCDEAAEGASMTNLCFVCSKMGNEKEAKEWEELARAVIGEVE